ncbi:16368_t:CDS:1, partial [Acaulospora colombiana]
EALQETTMMVNLYNEDSYSTTSSTARKRRTTSPEPNEQLRKFNHLNDFIL